MVLAQFLLLRAAEPFRASKIWHLASRNEMQAAKESTSNLPACEKRANPGSVAAQPSDKSLAKWDHRDFAIMIVTVNQLKRQKIKKID
jgi:hypothetical protein